jgi:hypothetical protein
MYVAGFDRGVRPIGDWSTLMILSSCSIPRIRLCAPGRCRERCSLFESALCTMSLISVDLPEPDTPVTAVNTPSGSLTSIDLRLCCVAPWIST